MPQKRKSANEMTDDEMMERAFSKRVVRRVKQLIGADGSDENEKDASSGDKDIPD